MKQNRKNSRNFKITLNEVLVTTDALAIYRFAKNNRHIPLDDITNRMIETGDPVGIYFFAKDIKNVNKVLLLNALCNLKCTFFIKLFLMNISDIPEDNFVIALSYINSLKDLYEIKATINNDYLLLKVVEQEYNIISTETNEFMNSNGKTLIKHL